jgi:hypothetical protein
MGVVPLYLLCGADTDSTCLVKSVLRAEVSVPSLKSGKNQQVPTITWRWLRN